jgi:thiosulfate reductase / polysulfide reductase chain A
MPLTRRQFIRIGAASAGVAAVGSGLVTRFWGLDRDEVADPGTEADRIVPTFCELCFWKCGILAHVRKGRVAKITGNPDHPLSRGRLCPRGTGGMGLLYDPDRLKKPLVRREKRGEQVFDEVSWETALDRVAEGMDKIRRDWGPEAMALFSHGYGGSWFKQLFHAYGSDAIAAPSYGQCRGPREAAFTLTFGQGLGSPESTDIANARVLTLIGSHLGENMHNTQVQDLAIAIDRGAELVVVDPRFSTVAGKARYWLPIRPGTDLALLLAWIHVILAENLFDAEYVGRYAIGLDQLREHVRDRTPDWAWTETGIPVERIVETARFIASARPASLVHPGRHVTWYGDDTQRERAIAILGALLGSWGRRGGFWIPAQIKVPKYPVPAIERVPRPPPDHPKGRPWPFAGEVLASGLCEAAIPGTADYDVKGFMVYGTNLVQALPKPEQTARALQALDLVVAIDVLPMEITGFADVVLPEATYLERFDDLDNSPWRVPYVALRQPAVDPLYESKPGWWIAKELGKRLGLAEHVPWPDGETCVRTRIEAAGLDWNRLREKGVIVASTAAAPGGVPKAPPVTIEDGLEPSFATPSGKIEIYSERLRTAGLDPLPVYTRPQPPPAGAFRMLFGRTPSHTFGRTTNNRFLSDVYSENELWMNEQAATERGLSSGDRVVLTNQAGVRSEPLRLLSTRRIRGDCVFLVHGYGHDAKGLTFAKGRGASDSRLVSDAVVDPIMGGTGMNVNFVRVQRAALPAKEKV